MRRTVLKMIVEAIAICAMALFLYAPPAYADGGVTFVDWDIAGEGKEHASTEPSGAWFAALHFDKNVAFADDGRDTSFIEENCKKIHLLTSDGQEVQGYSVKTGLDRAERRVIYLQLDEWLLPLTSYHIYIEPGIQAANGIDMSEEAYALEFKTDALCSNGYTLFQIAIVVVVPLLLIVGIVVGVARTNRRVR